MLSNALRCALPAVALIAPAAHAGFTASVTPAFRGAPDATFHGWESFVHPNTNANPPDVPGSDPGAELTQGWGNAYIDGHGNLSTLDVMAISIAGSVQGDLAEAVLQLATLDLPLQTSSLVLVYTGADGSLAGVAPASITTLVDDGTRRELVATWDLTTLAEDVTRFRLDFVAFGALGGLDAVELDLRAGTPAVRATCLGDGTEAVCPCGAGAPGRGCAAAGLPDGVLLEASGSPAADDVTLHVNGLRADRVPAVLVVRSSGAPAPVFGGDGLLCSDGQHVAVAYGLAAGGSFSGPAPHPGPAGTFTYQALYRSQPTGFCDPFSAFNTSNGLEVRWP